jgi:hypothetical protein
VDGDDEADSKWEVGSLAAVQGRALARGTSFARAQGKDANSVCVRLTPGYNAHIQGIGLFVSLVLAQLQFAKFDTGKL